MGITVIITIVAITLVMDIFIFYFIWKKRQANMCGLQASEIVCTRCSFKNSVNDKTCKNCSQPL